MTTISFTMDTHCQKHGVDIYKDDAGNKYIIPNEPMQRGGTLKAGLVCIRECGGYGRIVNENI